MRVGGRVTTPACPSYAGYRFPAEIISHTVWLAPSTWRLASLCDGVESQIAGQDDNVRRSHASQAFSALVAQRQVQPLRHRDAFREPSHLRIRCRQDLHDLEDHRDQR